MSKRFFIILLFPAFAVLFSSCGAAVESFNDVKTGRLVAQQASEVPSLKGETLVLFPSTFVKNKSANNMNVAATLKWSERIDNAMVSAARRNGFNTISLSEAAGTEARVNSALSELRAHLDQTLNDYLEIGKSRQSNKGGLLLRQTMPSPHPLHQSFSWLGKACNARYFLLANGFSDYNNDGRDYYYMIVADVVTSRVIFRELVINPQHITVHNYKQYVYDSFNLLKLSK
jgi:hypothetical protein